MAKITETKYDGPATFFNMQIEVTNSKGEVLTKDLGGVMKTDKMFKSTLENLEHLAEKSGGFNVQLTVTKRVTGESDNDMDW